MMTAESMLSKRPVLRINYCSFIFLPQCIFLPNLLRKHKQLIINVILGKSVSSGWREVNIFES